MTYFTRLSSFLFLLTVATASLHAQADLLSVDHPGVDSAATDISVWWGSEAPF